jgi:probable selenium-dependent hydroxylase accessory protein YqeC
LTALIGGGGKTSLLYALGRREAALGRSVLLTTATHLAWPPPEGVRFCSPATEEELWAEVRPGQMVLAGYPAEHQRMVGLSPDLLERACAKFDRVICEADGSRGLPLKFHREGEPCIPDGTGLVIQVAGLSALGRPAGETVHRWELAGFAREHVIDGGDVVRLVRRGFDRCGGMPFRCLLNQADTLPEPSAGIWIAKALSAAGVPTGVGSLKEEQILCWY